jgi:hypothetical protein
MGLLKNKLRIGAPEEKKALRIKPETVAVGAADDLVRELKDASLLARLNRQPEPRRREPCHVGCDCPPCRRGDCNDNVGVCMGSSRDGRGRMSPYGMPYGSRRGW